MADNKIYRGDIFWASNPHASGHIQDKLRPYLIISNNKANTYSDIILGIPLTTRDKKLLPTHQSIMLNGKKNTVLCEQIITLNKTNIKGYIDTVSDFDLQRIEKKIEIQLDLKGEKNDRV